MFYYLLKYLLIGPSLRVVGRPRVEGLENLPKEHYDALAAKHSLGRLGETPEVVALVNFLLSEEASFITGSYHLVDGGYTAV